MIFEHSILYSPSVSQNAINEFLKLGSFDMRSRSSLLYFLCDSNIYERASGNWSSTGLLFYTQFWNSLKMFFITFLMSLNLKSSSSYFFLVFLDLPINFFLGGTLSLNLNTWNPFFFPKTWISWIHCWF